jgi:hypothetical protein
LKRRNSVSVDGVDNLSCSMEFRIGTEAPINARREVIDTTVVA